MRTLPDPLVSAFAALRWLFAVAAALAVSAALGCADAQPPAISTPAPPPAFAPKPAAAAPTTTTTPGPRPTLESTATPVPTAALQTAPRPDPTAIPTPVPPPKNPPTATPKPVQAAPPPTPDHRRRGGVLNLASRESTVHHDVHLDVSPALSTWGPGVAYSRLMRHRAGPDVDLPSLAVECDLCLSWELETPTSVLFRLREGVRWQDVEPVNGRLLTSEDIAYSYVRQSQPSLPNAPLLHNVDTVHPLGPLELRITLKSQDADLFNMLADGHSKIVAREAVEQFGDLRDGPTVGTGPWVLENSDPTGIHLFSRNPFYFEPGLPLMDILKFHILPDPATRSAAFQVGMLDVHQMDPLEWLETLDRDPGARALFIREPGNGLEFAVKASQPPFDDLRVRRAAFLAMDPWEAIEEHWGGFGFVSPGFPVSEPGWLLDEPDLRRFLDRPGDAKALLEDAGLSDPIPVTIRLGDFGEAYLAHANNINVELQALGFAPEVEIVNRRVFGEDVWLGGDYQMFIGPTAPVSAPNGYLLPVLHSDGVWNTTGHADPELDRLLESQAVELDGQRRGQLIREIQERALGQAYRFMPAARTSIWAWAPGVRDFHPNFAGSEYIHWSRVWLER